jgi:glycosyltransferase involved in cell wall biosynthesis
MPKVSICVPNLNTLPYLPERFEAVFNQTFQDWELIVCDSYSDDGSWGYIQELSAREPRMRISQTPRKGVYAAFNDCIQLARGEHVYIATSDDTMAPDFLEKMVAALDQNSGCGLAHCCLDFIDEHGVKISSGHCLDKITGGRCWDDWVTTRFFGDWIKKYHVRPRGHDAVVALALKTVYLSVTQILVRRDLFELTGMFESRWGSFGDFEWQMRAALATKTVHVPEYLATWRLHPRQASQLEQYLKAIREGWFFDMATSAINFSRAHDLPVRGGLPARLRRFNWNEMMFARLAAEKTLLGKFNVLCKSSRQAPMLLGSFLQAYFRDRFLHQGPEIENEVRKELRRLGLDVLSMARLEN